jgi:hypothetical protein
MVIKPSDEQTEIVEALSDGYNVLVDSVAGSGKTTTILFLAKTFPEKRIIVVTYNARLKMETRNRVKKSKITNLEIHSYHSLGLEYYTKPCNTDTHLVNIVRHDMVPFGMLSSDIFVLDESQDMREDYYFFLRKVIQDMRGNPPQLFVMGDHKQCIYQFLKADSRYLTLADKIFPSELKWKKCYLKTSYRITKPMEWFMNEVVLRQPRMKSVKESNEPIHYFTGDPFFKVPYAMASEIKLLLQEGIKESDIFVIAPSIKTQNPNNPIKKFENLLVSMGIHCYVPMSDDEELKDEVTREKIVFSSFHQSKGLERKVVFVLGFSTAFYFTFKDAPQEVCPNLLYVASTRCLERMYLCGESTTEKPLPFLNHSLMIDSNNFKRHDIISKSSFYSTSSPKEYNRQDLRAVTQLTRFLPEECVNQIIELCDIRTIKPASKSIAIPSMISTEGTKMEQVSDLNGIAIPTIFEHRIAGQISIQMDLERKFLPTLKQTGNGQIPVEQRKWVEVIHNEPKSIADFLLLANLWSSHVSGYNHKVAQISEYNWLTEKNVEDLLQVLQSNIQGDPADMYFEEVLQLEGYKFNNHEVHIQGIADLVDDVNLWELKCVDSIKPEHIVQLALYAYIWQQTEYKERGHRRFRLFNFRTGEILEITGVQNLKMIVDIVLDNAYRQVPKLTDEEFIETCLKGPDFSRRSPILQQEDNSGCLIMDD